MSTFEEEGTYSDSVSQLWDYNFRNLTEVHRFPDYKRGILRPVQQYDPYVKTALKIFSPDLWDETRGKSRSPGDEYAVFERLLKYDARPLSINHFGNTRFRWCYKLALEQVMKEFKLDAPIVPRWILDVDLVSNTSSGFPHFARKSDIMPKVLQEGRFHFHHLKLFDLRRCPLLPCTPATRGGSSPNTERKTRLVWMYPAAMTACEAVYAQPLIEKIYSQKRDLLLTGVESKNRIQQFVSLISEDEGKIGIGLDFSSFDTFRSTKLIRDAFSVLEQNVQHGYYYDRVSGIQKGRSGVDRRSKKAFSNIVEYFINTPMLLPNGRVVTKQCGVPSGSHFTNLIDSIVNRIILTTFGLYHGIRLHDLKTNGDDSAFWVTDTNATGILDKAKSFCSEFYSMTVNTDKSCIAGMPSQMHVSGTTWTQAQPYRSTADWFQLALNPSSHVSRPFESFQRLLGIGIAGGFRDAKFSAFFTYFQTGYDCSHGPNLLNWKKLRFLEFTFGITDLPLVYKQGLKTNTRLRLIIER